MKMDAHPETGTPKQLNFNVSDWYRLPWSLTDNGISWIEVTTKCNLACKGCYRDQEKEGHKTLKEIEEDLAVFKKNRVSDCMSIAGGDPLVHPQICEIVKMVKKGGWKPVINTNGLAMSPKLLKRLKDAGAYGFTFHVDTSQTRRDSRAKTEGGHNALRLKYARMVAEAGGMSCAFNQTVTNETLDQVPDVVNWARKHPDIVSSVIFILYREPHLMGREFDWYAGGKPVNPYGTYEDTDNDWKGGRLLSAPDVAAKIREADPMYQPSAYLSGTVDPKTSKWTVATRVATKDECFGYVSPDFMELVQESHHFMKKKWLAYSSPKLLSSGRSALMATPALAKGMFPLQKRYLKYLARKPWAAKDKVYLQTFGIIQPVDVLADGQLNMCDGCPDMTVYKGKLYWSCRLEEVKDYGCFLSAVPSHAKGKSHKSKKPEEVVQSREEKRKIAEKVPG